MLIIFFDIKGVAHLLNVCVYRPLSSFFLFGNRFLATVLYATIFLCPLLLEMGLEVPYSINFNAVYL
jgi:hypothetical protein